ncbi:MAG: TerC family protein [Nitrospiraceae bacterium]|jgi:predicted tellurium resistance membrane protein TerC|nr:TerC family protein [Nitrospiraceae bacterium]
MEWISDINVWTALITLTVLEIILGIDNIVVISILTSKLPLHQQAKARQIGIGLAIITRILFLLSLVWLASLTTTLFTIFSNDISMRDLILIVGGLFLLYKATHEIHGVMEIRADERKPKVLAAFGGVVMQILVFDIIFSLDSVITAIGMAQQVGVMIAAVVIAMLMMLVASGSISAFIEKHPSLKMLALSFLLMIGVTLIAEGFDLHIPKGYIYFAMGFSGFVETMNILAATRRARATLE